MMQISLHLRAPSAQRAPVSSRMPRRSIVASAKLTPSGIEEIGGGSPIVGDRPTSNKAWELMSTTLKKEGLKFVRARELVDAGKKGIPIIDVRPEKEYNEGFIEGSVNVQIYRLITGWAPYQVARKIGFAFFGIPNGTEFNPNFDAELAEAVPDKDKGLIIVCQVGGSLEPNGASQFGRQSRSLIAAYRMSTLGYKNIKVLEGGVQQWQKEERELFEF